MTPRSQARADAVAVLLEAGWSAERIRQALGITDELTARLMRRARPLLAGDGCCHPRGEGRFCDAPVQWRGSVYCGKHHSAGWQVAP